MRPQSKFWLCVKLFFGRFTRVAFYQAGNCGDDDSCAQYEQ